MKKILQKDAPVLRKIAKSIRVADIKTPKIQKALREMSASLASQSDGVALAAPQIGYSLQVFVVSGKILIKNQTKNTDSTKNEKQGKEPDKETSKKIPDLVFINPKISKLSRGKEWVPEGCLSVRPLYGLTHRSKKATVTAYDKDGKKFTRGASGLLAQIFQHETDHLRGILFIDHAKEIREESPQK
jgi:peptide deformylase